MVRSRKACYCYRWAPANATTFARLAQLQTPRGVDATGATPSLIPRHRHVGPAGQRHEVPGGSGCRGSHSEAAAPETRQVGPTRQREREAAGYFKANPPSSVTPESSPPRKISDASSPLLLRRAILRRRRPAPAAP